MISLKSFVCLFESLNWKLTRLQRNVKGTSKFSISGILGADSVTLIDLTVSDEGGSKPGPNYVPGDHRQRNATAKRANYVVCRSPKGFRRPFNVVTRSFLKYRLRVSVTTHVSRASWRSSSSSPAGNAMVGATEETENSGFLLIVNQSIAAGSSESIGVIANRTRCRIATSLYSSIAFNALASSNKLLPAARIVNSGSSVSRSPESGGGRGRRKKLGAELLAAATRAEVVRAGLSREVRESERAVSSRAAAVAGVQQL
jgi:hypothetical protein